MNIPRLGPLHSDEDDPEWLISEPISIPYFDGLFLTFTLDSIEEEDEADALSAVEAFLALDSAARRAAGPYVFQNYRLMAEAVGADAVGCHIATPDDVWSHVHPNEIFVRRRSRDQIIYVNLTAECDWEPEHGLQIIYRRGNQLSRVSEQDGHLAHADAYGLPEDQDKIA